jgi:hypothetical protein
MSNATSSEKEAYFVGSHEALFEQVESTQCDACERPIHLENEPDGRDGYDVLGSGIYLWKRGDTVQLEKAPLCASCASAIGMTALARWEIEEEEG